MPRHEVDERCGSLGTLEACLQNHGVGPISTRYPSGSILRGDEPAAVFRRAEERREARVRIKTWPTQPIDGAIATNKRGCLAVSDERVVFNP